MTDNSLSTARAVERPSREAMLERAPSVQQFWSQNRDLFKDAWKQWEASESDGPNGLDSSLYDTTLRSAVELAWQDPHRGNGQCQQLAVMGLLRSDFSEYCSYRKRAWIHTLTEILIA